MRKVGFFDSQLIRNFKEKISTLSTVFSLFLIFVDIPTNIKAGAGVLFALVLVVIYIALWQSANKLKFVELDIEGSKVTIKSGDIFSERGLKVIAFNEYFESPLVS